MRSFQRTHLFHSGVLGAVAAAAPLMSATPLSQSLRYNQARRMMLPIQICSSSDCKNLKEAKLLVKWSSSTKRQVFLVPLTMDPQASAAQNVDGIIEGHGKATEIFHRLILNAFDVATILCALEGTIPKAEFSKRQLTMSISKDKEGCTNISGTIYPFNPAMVSNTPESERKLLVAILDRPTTVLFKHHLESILTEIFGIEHYWYVRRTVDKRGSSSPRRETQFRATGGVVEAPIVENKRGVFASQVEVVDVEEPLATQEQLPAADDVDLDDSDATLGTLLSKSHAKKESTEARQEPVVVTASQSAPKPSQDKKKKSNSSRKKSRKGPERSAKLKTSAQDLFDI